jgi:ADP-ribose pyrophosphatase
MIPKHARRVFRGRHFEVYHWDQKLYDGTRRKFERVRRNTTVDIIATVGDKIIILSQVQPLKKRYLCLPSGNVEHDENPKVAALRELKEETGYVPKNMMKFKEFHSSGYISYREIIFIARDCRKTSKQMLDGGEKITVMKKNFEEFLQLCRNPKFSTSQKLKLLMYEALLDGKRTAKLKKVIFGK